VKRTLLVLLSLLAIGMAGAQPPVDYTLMCGDDAIGAASYVAGAYHVVLLAGVTCEGAVTVAEDEALVVALVRDADGVTVTFGADAVVARVVEVPQQALEGKLNAHANRAAAGHGRETAAAMRERHQPDRPVLPEPPELPELPVVPEPPIVPGPPDVPLVPELPGLPELPVEPSVPETGGGRSR
jgi:hypothetical protein